MNHSRIIKVRLLLELLVLIFALCGVDAITSPTETTRLAILKAVTEQALDPSVLVETSSSMHFALRLRLDFLWAGTSKDIFAD